MAKAPKVQTLAQSMAALNPGYEEERAIQNERIEGLGERFESERMRLEGTRKQTFDDISSAATGRGVGAAFSGIPIDEQNRYLANEFLPGQQRLVEQERELEFGYRTNLAQLNREQRTAALSRVDQQQSALNQWNLQQSQIEAQRREAEIQRQWQAQQSKLDRQFQASQNAADRAASAANARASAGPAPSLDSQITSMLMGAAGDDGTVPKSVWQAAIRQAETSGMNFSGNSGFANTYWAFRPK